MERKYKITIPEPCSENWDKMIPNENGRFCMNCSKTVIDFTSKVPEEIQQFFIKNKSKNICGRFKKSQLDTIIIKIPNQVLYSQNQYHKIFSLALFISMGTTLFSCQDKNGNKQKIDKIEVIDDASSISKTYIGKTMLNPNDTVRIPPPPLPKVNQIKFVKPHIQSNFKKPTTTNCEQIAKQNTVTDDIIYNGGIGFETTPEFDGGIEQFYTYFTNEFITPENIDTKKTKIIISFIVEKDGSLTYVKPSVNISRNLEQEVIRVLQLSPKWHPGQQNGKKTKTRYTLVLTIQKHSLSTASHKQNPSTITNIQIEKF
ncbi:energy transducer TonB [Flavobacterium agrisoli]|uniref:TonB-like protein n=1 Tax=Flavobacterium agrisoli TaxID=2793066 RepID=A0A934PPA4_9FLAO|nr:hypothetical protein [Flavobacterium agrisoli]MBK0370613.1 hypothetical protein [Flavobacterium agrisoli]